PPHRGAPLGPRHCRVSAKAPGARARHIGACSDSECVLGPALRQPTRRRSYEIHTDSSVCGSGGATGSVEHRTSGNSRNPEGRGIDPLPPYLLETRATAILQARRASVSVRRTTPPGDSLARAVEQNPSLWESELDRKALFKTTFALSIAGGVLA